MDGWSCFQDALHSINSLTKEHWHRVRRKGEGEEEDLVRRTTRPTQQNVKIAYPTLESFNGIRN